MEQALGNCVENVLCNVKHLVFVYIDLFAVFFGLSILIFLPVVTVLLKLLVVGCLLKKSAWLIITFGFIVSIYLSVVVCARQVPQLGFLFRLVIFFVVVRLVVFVGVFSDDGFFDFFFSRVSLLCALSLRLSAVA